jgi:hypothetical protein
MYYWRLYEKKIYFFAFFIFLNTLRLLAHLTAYDFMPIIITACLAVLFIMITSYHISMKFLSKKIGLIIRRILSFFIAIFAGILSFSIMFNVF